MIEVTSGDSPVVLGLPHTGIVLPSDVAEVLNQTGRELETVLMGMMVYLIISLSISAVMNWYNNRMKLVER